MTQEFTGFRGDAETPIHLLRRFDIEVLEADVEGAIVEMSMPLAGMLSPFTDQPTTGPLGILVDGVGGLVNHFRRRTGEWTVTTELAIDLSPDGAERATAAGAPPVVALGRALGARDATALAICTLTCDGTVIGSATVRSAFLTPEKVELGVPDETLERTARTSLAELMAVETVILSNESCVLRQRPDPFLDNAVGIVNGGVAAAALELTASAVVNTGAPGMRTASVRVNFLRPFFAGNNSRYEATPQRVGRSTAVADAHALAEDGRPALTARVTMYQ